MRLALAALIAAAACGGDAMTTPPPNPAPGDIQMNDLSVLLPLPRTAAEQAAMLAPSADARGGELVPESTYDSAAQFLDYEAMRAIAFRVDPCFGQLGPVTDPTQCHAQLRIVFQPIFGDGSATADDAGLHAFYALTDDELLAIVAELVDARASDAGSADLGPLAPHPTLVSEGLDGPLAHAFDAILVKYAGLDNLIRMTEFTGDHVGIGSSGAPQTNEDFWDFVSFDVANGSATPRDVPTLPAAMANSGMSIQASTDPLVSSGSPATVSADSIAVLEDTNAAGSATMPQLQAVFDAALRIQNPSFHSPDTIDCASCHLVGPAIDLVAGPLGLSAVGDVNAFSASGIPAADLARTTPLNGSGTEVLNIHAFSYMAAEPMINQRVINETAANLAYIRSLE
jgi:hypothetical protein